MRAASTRLGAPRATARGMQRRLGWCLAIQVRLWSSTPLPHVPDPQAPASPAGSTRKHLIIIMKSWRNLDDITRRRAPAREIGFLTAVFVALIVIAGLDTIFPGVTHKLTSHLSANQGNTGFRHAEEPFEWSQVRTVRSSDTQACDLAASYQMKR
jgi:hypothetical protein